MSKITTDIETLTTKEEMDEFVRKFLKTKVLDSHEPMDFRYLVSDKRHIRVSFRRSENGRIYKVLIFWDFISDKWVWDTIF